MFLNNYYRVSELSQSHYEGVNCAGTVEFFQGSLRLTIRSINRVNSSWKSIKVGYFFSFSLLENKYNIYVWSYLLYLKKLSLVQCQYFLWTVLFFYKNWLQLSFRVVFKGEVAELEFIGHLPRWKAYFRMFVECLSDSVDKSGFKLNDNIPFLFCI